MSIMVNSGSHVSRVQYGDSRIVSVWEGNKLKFPNGLIRNNGPVSAYTSGYGIQKALSAAQTGQSGQSAHIGAGVLPNYFDAYRGFYCYTTGSYTIRYKTTLKNKGTGGTIIQLSFRHLIYNEGTGSYNSYDIVTDSPEYAFSSGETKMLDWGDGFSVYLTAGNYYVFALSDTATTFEESNASTGLIYNG